MGQAFDEHGNVLGEAYGKTKQEVFDTLNEQHQDAFEIRIRQLREAVQLREAAAKEEHRVRPLTDEEVDQFLANCEVTEPERLARIRKRFDEKWAAIISDEAQARGATTACTTRCRSASDAPSSSH